MNKVSRVRLAAALLLALAATAAHGQASCSSDGVKRPAALLERFINADCESCWSDGNTPEPRPGELALDWVVPGNRGGAAPLANAAARDSMARLHALRREVPSAAAISRLKAQETSQLLRVAHGPPFNDYLGASIELKPGSGGPWRAWLLLVETLPAGAEGSPVERHLVRNVLQLAWEHPKPQSSGERPRLFESRPMRIPDGARADRLRVVGWVEDPHGRIRAIAQSRCAHERR